jgi:hypothetical protein
MEAPLGAASPSRWISKYLNTRFFEFPSTVSVKAREGWEHPKADRDRNYLRTITGQHPYLEQHATSAGSVQLTHAVARWWILKDEPAITSNSGFIESSGHVAALYQNELYELSTSRSGMSRLQQFGVTFGYRFVVIYVEPNLSQNSLTTNTARTTLLINNELLPWADWAEEFREHLPPEIEQLIAERAAASANTDHQGSIRNRLKEIMDLFKVSRYRPTPAGHTLVDKERHVPGGVIHDKPRKTRKGTIGNGSPGSRGTSGNANAVFEKKGGIPAKKVNPDPYPTVRWVTVKDRTREYGDIEDRAAKFLPDQNLLLVNADFRVFSDMADRLIREFIGVPGVADLVQDGVRGWFEQALVETVIGVQGLANSKEWSQTQIDMALSEEAFTAAIMQRYHVHVAVKREISSKVGTRRAKAAA